MTMVCSLIMCVLGAETIYVNQYNIFYDSGMKDYIISLHVHYAILDNDMFYTT